MKPSPWKYWPAWNLQIYRKNRFGRLHTYQQQFISFEDSCPRKLQGFRYGNGLRWATTMSGFWFWPKLSDPKNPQISYPKILNDKQPIDNQKRSINMKSGILGGRFLFFCRWKLLFIWLSVELENDGPRLPRRFLWFWTRWCFQTSGNMFVKLDQGKQHIESPKLRCADRNQKGSSKSLPCYERILNRSELHFSLPSVRNSGSYPENSQSFRPPKRISRTHLFQANLQLRRFI